MNSVLKYVPVFLAMALLSPAAGLDPAAWRFGQPVRVAAPGLTRLDLPVETISVSLADLADVRLLSPAGVETPLIIETRALEAPRTRAAGNFKTLSSGSETVVLLETGAPDPIRAVILGTPAPDFIKSVKIEAGSEDGTWQELVQGAVIFRQRDGASGLRVPLPGTSAPRLRITIDDRRSAPVPFTGATLDFMTRSEATTAHPISIEKVEENQGETVLTLGLGAANLNLASLTLSVKDPVFSRQVHLDYLSDDRGVPRLQRGAGNVICRLPEKDGLRAESLDLPVVGRIPSDRATLTIENGDSPPLGVTGVSAARYPVTLVFFAQEAGPWKLLTGQRTAARPRYDLSALEGELRSRPAGTAQAGTLVPNPSYQEPPALPAIPVEGAGIDLAGWTFRKPVLGAGAGIIRLELDEEVLSRCQSELSDLRLVQNGRQIPWVRSPSDAVRSIQPTVSAYPDPKRPTVSRWKLQHPYPGLMVDRLTCTSPAPLFDRTFTLWGNRKDSLGHLYRVQYDTARWRRQPTDQTLVFSLPLPSIRLPEECFLETDNGDNPPIGISDVKFVSGVKAVAAKLAEAASVFLYYGNAAAGEPRYDLQLVRGELLAATPIPTTLGVVEILRANPVKPDAHVIEISAGSPWLWGALGLVVAVLLWVVARMLPAAPGKSEV